MKKKKTTSKAPHQVSMHIRFGDKRTSISVDDVLFDLLALKLKVQPDDPEAFGRVRQWLQVKLVEELGESPERKNASQWARRLMVLAVADRRLVVDRYIE